MAGRCFKIPALLAGLAAGLSGTAALAADYSPPPPPIYIPPPPVVEVVSGWYLRGDIGITNQQLKNMTNVLDVNNSVQNVGFGFDSSGLFGLGIGYSWNDWLRFDFTGEYRSRANFHGSQIIDAGGGPYTNEYYFSKSEWLFLANAYVDLGTWHGFTPFIGAGAGGARVTIHSFQDINTPNAGVAFANDHSQWNFAWALHAGIGYRVNKNLVVELAYRYVHLGDAQSGDIYTYTGVNNINNPMQLDTLTSHDVKLGLRFSFDEGGFDFWSRPKPAYYAPPPVYTQPAPPPVYAPPPQVYHQPPVYQPPVYQPPVYPQHPIRSRG